MKLDRYREMIVLMVGRDPDCDCIVLGPFLSEGTTNQHRARLYGPSLMNLIVPVYHDITNIVVMAEVVVVETVYCKHQILF